MSLLFIESFTYSYGKISTTIEFLKGGFDSIFMKKKWNVIFSIFIAAILFIIGTFIFFPEYFFPDTSLTYAESIEVNWELKIPNPDEEIIIKNDRGSHGDGDTITELYYEKSNDIQSIKNLSNSWISGEKFEKTKKELPTWVGDLIKEVNKEATYFYLKKDRNDYIIFEVIGNKVTIYESYT